MIKNPIIRNHIMLAGFIVIVAVIFQSCGKPIYIFGALTSSKFYTYNGKSGSTYNSQGGVDWYSKLGVQIGLGANIANLSNNLTIQTEINTSYQGARYEDITQSVNGNINLLYLSVPVLLNYQFKGNFFGEAGFQPGLLISARDRIDGHSTFFSDYIKNFDFGITGGFGYKFNDKIGIGVRASLGFLNISVAETDGKSNVVLAVRGTYVLKKE
jgi:hypothetical protein